MANKLKAFTQSKSFTQTELLSEEVFEDIVMRILAEAKQKPEYRPQLLKWVSYVSNSHDEMRALLVRAKAMLIEAQDINSVSFDCDNSTFIDELIEAGI